jgi:hypothetical protein
MQDSVYKIFSNWLFDKNPNSDIPNKDVLLKYNSPINHTYVLKLFMRNHSLNFFLNWYFNNINLRYLQKEDFFKFIKKCVKDFRVNRNSLMFFPYQKKHELFDRLQEKMPMMKNDDLSLLCERIEEMDERDSIYSSLGIDKPKVEKSKKKIDENKVSLKDFIEKNFNVVKM